MHPSTAFFRQGLCGFHKHQLLSARPGWRRTACISCSHVQHLQPSKSPGSASFISSTARTHEASTATDGSNPPRQRESLRPQTYYELFPESLSNGPPPHGSFSINSKQLRKEFLQLQAKAHPDRHPQESKIRAEATSAHINEAYKTLGNPLLRAQYLLSLRGIDTAEDETAKVEDPELLMEVLDMREQIEGAESEEELVPLKEANNARIAGSIRVLEDAFAKDDERAAKDEAVKLRYWINIKESLDAWEKGKPVVLVH
ncbi:MAG: hypothetical protein M1837_002708 [Sclerophora amabilis]|nr:MAG: hypothetical protein M1837_002708 [Sclerophora amabilis]